MATELHRVSCTCCLEKRYALCLCVNRFAWTSAECDLLFMPYMFSSECMITLAYVQGGRRI